jgi:potassium efflux system protein
MIRASRCLALGLVWTSVWPAYLALLALVVRRGPWPMSLAIPLATILTGLALAATLRSLLGWIFRPSGWAVSYLDIPETLAAQLDKVGRSLVLLAIVLLLPAYLLGHGEIAPEARPVAAPLLSRFLVIAFELMACAYLIGVSRRGGVDRDELAATDAPEPATSDLPPALSPAAMHLDGDDAHSPTAQGFLSWLERRRRLLPWFGSFAVLGIIVLEARGYSFTARKLAAGLTQSGLVVAIGWAFHRAAAKAIGEHPWPWTGSAGSWTRTLTTAMTAHAGTRLVAGLAPARSTTLGAGGSSPPASAFGPKVNPAAPTDQAEVLARRARQLVGLVITILGGLALVWVWDLDLALIRTLADKPLWRPDSQAENWVTLGELIKAIGYVLLGVAAWRHMNPFFALFLYPRMTDDPGVRFAVVTLCRYAVLGLTTILALGAIHLDMTKIGVVVAALGVGLGFGLQEVVSNFVCGIILLLERPIRIGDIVTVAATSGRVDRINIRATTIVNGDNQSMIVPNREFITGNLVNWTYHDKVMRVPIRLGIAYGTDPDRVVDLLLAIVRADADVLRNPVPAAQMEAFGDSALMFALYLYVPDPSLIGRVRHRICAEIQRRFAEENIQIPFPTRELLLNRIPDELTRALQEPKSAEVVSANRVDPSSKTPAGPHAFAVDPSHRSKAAAYKEDFCRGVDE